MSDPDSPVRKTLEVIQGNWVSAPEWLNFPKTVRARSPSDKNAVCRVRVSRSDVIKAAENRRRQPAYELWGNICGRVPPVPQLSPVDNEGLTTLFDAHACFCGIKRPMGDEPDGDRFVAYVLKPKFFLNFSPRPPAVFTEKVLVPEDVVFVAYVRLDEPPGPETKGVLTHWHFVECDPADTKLPVGFGSRYRDRMW